MSNRVAANVKSASVTRGVECSLFRYMIQACKQSHHVQTVQSQRHNKIIDTHAKTTRKSAILANWITQTLPYTIFCQLVPMQPCMWPCVPTQIQVHNIGTKDWCDSPVDRQWERDEDLRYDWASEWQRGRRGTSGAGSSAPWRTPDQSGPNCTRYVSQATAERSKITIRKAQQAASSASNYKK